MFGNEIPDQVGDDVIAGLVTTSLPAWSQRHCRLGHNVIAGLTGNLLLIKRSSNVNSASNSTTYHRVVTDAEESHYLNVCRNRRQTECNQTCLNCRGAKEEKPVGLN